MKNAIILHGTEGTSHDNWFPWLKAELEKRGYKVWVPDLPDAVTPNVKLYNDFLLSSGYIFDSDTVLIGHSSGAVAILGLLQKLPEGTRIKVAVLVGSFIDNLGRDDLKGLFLEPLDFENIKNKAGKFILIHSNDDPYCPLPGAEKLRARLDGELLVQEGQKHFSIGTAGEKYKEFPYLLELLSTK